MLTAVHVAMWSSSAEVVIALATAMRARLGGLFNATVFVVIFSLGLAELGFEVKRLCGTEKSSISG